MKGYAIVCAVALVAVTAFGCFGFASAFGVPVWSALLYEVGAISAVLFFDLAVLWIVRLLPGKWFLPERKLFKTDGVPYSFLHIERWQASVPFTGSFQSCLQKKNPSALLEGMIETGRVETAHWVFSFLGFLSLLFFPANTLLWFALPVSLVNFVLAVPPALVARFTRPVLERRYREAVSREAKRKAALADA